MTNSNRNRDDNIEIGQKRKIKPTRRSVSGKFPFKGISSIPYESTLERDFLERQNYFLNVSDVIAQPVEIPFVSRNGRSYTYTPDFLVYYKMDYNSDCKYPKPVLIEVKYEADWRGNWREWLPKWKAARRLSVEQGWIFHVYDENRIRDQVLENINFLKPYRRRIFDREEIQSVLTSLKEMGSASMDYLLARHFKGAFRADGIALIWHMLSIRVIDCDPFLRLNNSTTLWVNDNV